MEVMYPIGGSLVSFMIERHFILLYNDFDPIKVIPKEKDKKYYLPRNLYAVCNFNVALLPIKLNLPMICPPLEWKSVRRSGKKPRNLSELSGGYLSNISGEIYDRYRLLTSENTNHFYIYLGDNYEKLCGVMNKLQGQAFKINSSFLHHLLKNEYYLDLVREGLLMPGFISQINNIPKVSTLLREFHIQNEEIYKLCGFNVEYFNKKHPACSLWAIHFEAG